MFIDTHARVRRGLSVAFLLAPFLLLGCGGGASPEPATPATEPAPAPAPVEPAPAAAPAPAAPVTPAQAPDPLEAGPTIYKKAFENDSVRVFEVTFKPGEKIAKHRHPDHVVYVISPGKLRITSDGPPSELELKAGQTVFIPAEEHAAENIGTTEVKLAVVELRSNNYPAAVAGGDPVTVGPNIYKKVFENERVRVLEITFKKGAKIAAHAHPDHAVYVLTDGKLKITPEKASAQEIELKAGQAVFIPAEAHSAENTGKAEMKAVVFELRSAK